MSTMNNLRQAAAGEKPNHALTARTVASQAGMGNVKAFFDSQKATLAAVLPKHVSPDRMLKIALGALRTTPKLMEARTDTLLGAIIQCAQLGLEPNTPLGHAYLIPFQNRNKNLTEVQIVFGYKGLIDLARRSGQIISISAHEVREFDDFSYEYGLDEKLVHRPSMGERGRVIAFYAVAKLVGGGYAFEVMSAQDVNNIRDASQNYKFARDKATTVWGQHYVEMGRKTVLRRLFKFLPVSIELASAVTMDGKAEAGQSQGAFEDVLQGEYVVTDEEAPEESVNTETGEVTQAASNPPINEEPQASQFAVNDALKLVVSGNFDEALDMARDFSSAQKAQIDAAIKAKSMEKAV